MTTQPNINLWFSPEHALDYLRRADTIPHRTEGEATLLEFIPASAKRILDLGSGAGRLLGIVRAANPNAEFVAVDSSPTMLENLRTNFANDPRVTVAAHDLNQALPSLGKLMPSYPALLFIILCMSGNGAYIRKFSPR